MLSLRQDFCQNEHPNFLISKMVCDGERYKTIAEKLFVLKGRSPNTFRIL